MCDEYQQSLERQKLLEGKVMELKKSLGEMTSGRGSFIAVLLLLSVVVVYVCGCVWLCVAVYVI